MKRIRRILNISAWSFVLWTLLLSGVALAADDVGSMIALRGKALIERDRKLTDAKIKDGILLRDSVETRDASRAKILFIDDSVLNIAEKSRVVIKEFVYSKDKGGRSIFNLLDGKMKSVVGKTNFEVHTPTSVAAARGTIILHEVGTRNGKKFTTIICEETDKEIIVTSPDPAIRDRAVLTTGMMITIVEGEPFPVPTLIPRTEIKDRSAAIDPPAEAGFFDVFIPGPGLTNTSLTGSAYLRWSAGGISTMDMPATNSLYSQPPVSRTTPVTIDVIFK